MKQEAVQRIKEALTPQVTIESCFDTKSGIVMTVKHTYPLGDFTMEKVVNVKADKEGNILEAVGLF